MGNAVKSNKPTSGGRVHVLSWTQSRTQTQSWEVINALTVKHPHIKVQDRLNIWALTEPQTLNVTQVPTHFMQPSRRCLYSSWASSNQQNTERLFEIRSQKKTDSHTQYNPPTHTRPPPPTRHMHPKHIQLSTLHISRAKLGKSASKLKRSWTVERIL